MKTILLSLNEVNFEYVKFYFSKNLLPNLELFFSNQKLIKTQSEKEFHNQEPWIQWVSLHSGKTLEEHGIFRLGDIENLEYPQIFEEIEEKGKKVGAMFPFNSSNRLKEPIYFLPDPWTETKISADPMLKRFFTIIRKLVNSNANGKVSKLDYLNFLLGFIRFVPFKNWGSYLNYLNKLKLPGTKAIILDHILGDVFIKFQHTRPTDFSNLMLNACAHVQHHYLFNSEAYNGENVNPEWYCPQGHDPIYNALRLYDNILGRLMKLKNTKLIIATALHQQPHEDNTYFWRFLDHLSFAKELGLPNFKHLVPRMSRDFLVEYENEEDCLTAEKILTSFTMKRDNIPLFRLDNRGKSIFVELVYPNDIQNDDVFVSEKYGTTVKDLRKKLGFVAIRNGEHNGIGYLITNFEHNLDKQIPITTVKDFILENC